MVIFWILLVLVVLVLVISYLCFRIAFLVTKKELVGPNDFPIPDGPIYEPFREQMVAWMKEVRALPSKAYVITSHDGLTLYGKYYEYAPGAPLELMFHGYRGNAERDLCGGVQRAFCLGHSALIVDQRASCHSDGNIISFGVNEHRDCLAWLDFAIQTFGPDVKIILTGISMGATTVLLAAGTKLPENVIGVLADCGFSSAREIIQLVAKKINMPSKVSYPFVWLGARIFGRFNLSASNAPKALTHCQVPVIFFHGENDDFVPCYMSKVNFDACPSRKQLVTIPGAGHGLSYLVDPDAYLQAMREFFDPIL
jgi:pimeloyl-ACP methyl ester carboxylesterase